MAGTTDIYSSLLGATATVSKLTQSVPKAGGNFTAVNFLSSIPTQIIGASSGRTNITFHNPGSVTCFVAPLTATSTFSGAFAPGPSFEGGSIVVVPGAWITLTMPGTGQSGGGYNSINGAWVGWASSASQPFTIMDQ